MEITWRPCGSGYLARNGPAIYMAYQSFDVEMGTPRWFARFETVGQWVDFGDFDGPNDAKQSCNDHATKFEPQVKYIPAQPKWVGSFEIGSALLFLRTKFPLSRRAPPRIHLVHDGIYSFHVTSNETVLKGFSTVENGTIRGINPRYVYVGGPKRQREKNGWMFEAVEYGVRPSGLSLLGYSIFLSGEESEDHFTLEGALETYSTTRISMKGRWLCDIP
jgi:hypothetical protein